MISHEEDFDKANLVLTIDTQRGLQGLFDYIIYLGIKVHSPLDHEFLSVIFFLICSQVKFFPISSNPIVFTLILV